MQLTDLSVRHLKTEAKQRSYFDDTVQGFGVRVSPGGTKTFVLVYGPARERISIGRYGVISLADARAEAKRILAERTLGARRPKHVNTYTADLHNSFMSDRENWTQEIVFPTKHIALQIHFPKDRPPKRLRCKMIQGVTDKQVKTNATIAELSEDTCIIWEIQNPKLKDIFKLEWAW